MSTPDEGCPNTVSPAEAQVSDEFVPENNEKIHERWLKKKDRWGWTLLIDCEVQPDICVEQPTVWCLIYHQIPTRPCVTVNTLILHSLRLCVRTAEKRYFLITQRSRVTRNSFGKILKSRKGKPNFCLVLIKYLTVIPSKQPQTPQQKNKFIQHSAACCKHQ